jgi:hypothetical protein
VGAEEEGGTGAIHSAGAARVRRVAPTNSLFRYHHPAVSTVIGDQGSTFKTETPELQGDPGFCGIRANASRVVDENACGLYSSVITSRHCCGKQWMPFRGNLGALFSGERGNDHA